MRIFLLILSSTQLLAQSPLTKQWDYRYGGTGYDFITSFQQTTDGGFILGGYSGSDVSGDKTQPSWGGNLDYWIVKTDALGVKQWDKRFGGFGNDVLSTVQQTFDGGYILAGYSDSQAGGDKTQASRGGNDYWIVKTDSAGNKIWDRRFGADFDELLAAAWQTPDGGFILGGYSGSGINGDKSQASQGFDDYWMVKTDAIGTLLWDKTFGGSDYDFMFNLLVTSDGGFLLGGSSASPAGGDKSQNSWGVYDCWVIRTDSAGNKLWDADYGGFDYDQVHSFCETSGGDFLLGCYSTSGIGGNKTQNTWGQGDVWLLKITASGSIAWDKDLGGTDMEDGIASVFENSDGNFFISCNSFSGIGGDKTESNLGLAQAWIIKTDTLGNKLWDKTILTDPDQKVYPLMVQTDNGCYAIAEATYGDALGDKTQSNWDTTLTSTDYWIITYCDTTAIPTAAFTSLASVCPGTCIDFTNLSAGATSYQWFFPGSNTLSSTDVNPQGICYPSSGSYDVTLIASGPSGSDSITVTGYITVFAQPAPQAITQSGDTLFANPGSVTYQWYLDGNLIPGATAYLYVAAQSGNYNVVAADSNGCEVEAAIFDVIAFAGSQPYSHPAVYLHTAGIKVIADISGTGCITESIVLIDLTGRIIRNYEVSKENLFTCDISGLPFGMYLTTITCMDKSWSVKLCISSK